MYSLTRWEGWLEVMGESNIFPSAAQPNSVNKYFIIIPFLCLKFDWNIAKRLGEYSMRDELSTNVLRNR